MLTSLGLLALSLCPQAVPRLPETGLDPRTTLRVVSAVGVLRPGGMDPRALELGDGGFPEAAFDAPLRGAPAEASGRRRRVVERDPFQTAGGAVLQVRTEGVKVTLPNGHELLVDPRGRVHLRDGGYTEKSPAGLVLWLGDGSLIECLPGDRGLSSVRLFRSVGDAPETLWRNGERSRRRRSRRDDGPRGRGIAALGDGRTLYALNAFGPVVSARRICTPRLVDPTDAEVRAVPPAAAVILLGDLLRGSLGELPAHSRHAAAGRVQVHQRADLLAGAAGGLFAEPMIREARIGDECAVDLGPNLRLRVDARHLGRVSVELWNADGVAIAQWIHTNRTLLHLLEEHEDGSVHYVMPALTIDRRFWNPLPFQNDSATVGDARSLLIPEIQAEALTPGR